MAYFLVSNVSDKYKKASDSANQKAANAYFTRIH